VRFLAITFIFLLMPLDAFAGDIPFVGATAKMFVVLLIMVLVLVSLGWIMKKYGPIAKVRKTMGFEVVGQVPLNPKASLALVKVGKSSILIGVTHYGVTLIKDLGENTFDAFVNRSGSGGGHETQ